ARVGSFGRNHARGPGRARAHLTAHRPPGFPAGTRAFRAPCADDARALRPPALRRPAPPDAMPAPDRRGFLEPAARGAAALAAPGALPPSIRRALATPAATVTGTIRDVQHVVILMQENRSFDHYFGTLRGVRGFGDRHTVP